jgi:2-polyprenyl-3-methyl-5-hydroxy-6-metoxy-1,4-benzoquinol methylase
MAKIDGEHIKLTEPSTFLVENIDLLSKGKVLDLAMGGGRNAVYLAEKGFEVEGVDVSSAAVESAKKLADSLGIEINAHIVDLEQGYKIPHEEYDVIICFNYLQRSLIPDIRNGLKRGGVVVYETYIVDQAQYGRPQNPDYLLRHNELLDVFQDFRCLRYREGLFTDRSRLKAIASIVAQKSE